LKIIPTELENTDLFYIKAFVHIPKKYPQEVYCPKNSNQKAPIIESDDFKGIENSDLIAILDRIRDYAIDRCGNFSLIDITSKLVDEINKNFSLNSKNFFSSTYFTQKTTKAPPDLDFATTPTIDSDKRYAPLTYLS
jgi:hypothetical protein